MNAQIVYKPSLESRICKILDEKCSLLTDAEKRTTECLRVARSTSAHLLSVLLIA